jgi:hypothetical protein
MTPNKFPLNESPTIAVLLAKLQRALDEERRDNTALRLRCAPDCREHFPAQLLADFTESVTRVENWSCLKHDE